MTVVQVGGEEQAVLIAVIGIDVRRLHPGIADRYIVQILCHRAPRIVGGGRIVRDRFIERRDRLVIRQFTRLRVAPVDPLDTENTGHVPIEGEHVVQHFDGGDLNILAGFVGQHKSRPRHGIGE